MHFYPFLSIILFLNNINFIYCAPTSNETCQSLAKLPKSACNNNFREWTLAGKCAKESLKVSKLPEETMDTPRIIKYYGYRLESHIVKTSDGYRLTLFHILPRGKNVSQDLKPVLLQHGVFASSTSFIFNLPNQSLAYLLSDNGYDVWLSNSRGTTYSPNHENFTTQDSKYWDFTWQDLASKDLPAIVDYILKVTNRKRLAYVGHSQGTLIGFAKFSADPDFTTKKINHFFAMAPVATVEYVQCPPRMAMRLVSTIQLAVESVSGYFSVPNDLIKKKVPVLCKVDELKNMCENALFDYCGPQPRRNINQTRIDVYLKIYPDRTSIKNVIHFGQMANSGKMQKYDYLSPKINMEKYGQKTPPEFRLENMKVNTTLFYSPIDGLGTEADLSNWLKKILNLSDLYRIPDYSHMDFLWAVNAKEKVYDKIIGKLGKLEF